MMALKHSKLKNLLKVVELQRDWKKSESKKSKNRKRFPQQQQHLVKIQQPVEKKIQLLPHRNLDHNSLF